MIRLKSIGIIILVLLFVSCKNKGTSKSSNQQDTVSESVSSDSLQFQDSIRLINSSKPDIELTRAIWVYDVMADTIVQIKEVNRDTLTSEKLIDLINTEYNDQVHIDFSRIAGDTIFIVIKNPDYMTQQMGSSGADAFMISTTFTLTELPGIEYVNFDFQEGDHAAPGTYSRKQYWDWLLENKKLNKK
ncbi:MAG: hypothetical protein V2A67_06300 [Bacteroidota bacterium]